MGRWWMSWIGQLSNSGKRQQTGAGGGLLRSENLAFSWENIEKFSGNLLVFLDGKGWGGLWEAEVSSSKVSGPEVFPAWGREVQECEKHYGFQDTLVRILLVAAVISFVLAWYDGEEGGETEITAFVEPLVIFLILIANAIVGVWQENNAEKALEALKEIQSEQAAVIRNNQRIPNLPAKELVPGDIVELKGSLTGESEAVNKTNKPVPEDADIQGKRCMVFAGTTVVNGNCICLVTQTGMETEIGKVHTQIHVASQSEEDTPLKKKLNEFGESLTVIIGVICALVWLINVKYFLNWEYVDGWPSNFKFSFEKCTYYFKIAVALAVAAIPEGLPAVITTCLALGTRKMAQKNALVRKLPSVETLGCTTVICSDKTGTLTTNQMAVAKLVAMGSRAGALRKFRVDGTTYSPFDGKIHDWPCGRMDANLQMIAKISAVCNDAGVAQSEHKYVANGMPTEAALKVLVEKMGPPAVDDDKSFSSSGDLLRCCQRWNENERRIATLEFDRDRKSMGVIVNSHSGKKSLLVKGAVENLLERSNSVQLLDGSVVELGDNSRSLILEALHEMSSGALRCLGFAYKDELPDFATYDGDENHPAHGLLLNPANYSSIERNLTFVGLVGLRDPPRAEVHQAIEDCRAAGVFGPNEDIRSKSLTGKEFMELRDQKAHLRQNGGLLFSRAEPRHKQEIVRLLKEDGEVVAMTGDGVNDAPALKLADIGIAMGIAGTEVAKEASDMVLADDNFSTIVAAVGEGRSIYNNMKALSVVEFLVTNYIDLGWSWVREIALDNPRMVAYTQGTSNASFIFDIPNILHCHIVPLDACLPGLTVLSGLHPIADRDIMKKPPRRSDDSLISAWILFRYLQPLVYLSFGTRIVSFLGIDLSGDGHTLVTYTQLADWGQCSSWENFTISPFTAGAQVFTFNDNPCDYFQGGKVKATTLSLSVLVAIEMFNSLNALSEDGSLLVMPPWVNPWLCLNEWLLVLAVAFPVILIDEILKLVGRCTSGFQTSSTRKSLKPKSE
ncbi:Calcium-transporting ATPase 4, endoplasmic reticulum-type [Vitis vinifera]|uniref:Calcium-transporting ATPase 4, endoplasmic reticulum-type n=1 Tax=Vitis vinifera TaxID=29760 RepID=A0A438DW62_VITVI|nr:Calcium-transporting ATPase 4, endoplasmic reticulum-type [Vitis vinifera]